MSARSVEYAAIVQATWWVAALDERLWKHHKRSYKVVRDAHDFVAVPRVGSGGRGIATVTSWATPQVATTAASMISSCMAYFPSVAASSGGPQARSLQPNQEGHSGSTRGLRGTCGRALKFGTSR